MITKEQKEKLEAIKPRGYRKKVQEKLKEQGYDFKIETIKQVYIGNRSNVVILSAITDVFLGINNDQEITMDAINEKLGITPQNN